MSLRRYLDTFERQAMDSPTAVTVGYRGTLDLALLDEAFGLLCERHPVLRARIRTVGDEGVLEVPRESHPVLVVHADGGGRSSLGATAASWEIARCVAQLDLVPDEDGGIVALFTDHAIADGRSKHALFQELWELYTDLDDGVVISPGLGTSLPRAPSALFEQYIGGDGAAVLAESSSSLTRRSFRARRRYLVCGRPRTDGLVALGRQAGTSMNALICGAIAVAQRAMASTHSGPVPMTCWAPVDYRDRVEPPVAPTAATNFGAPKEIPITVSGSEDPLEVGRRVKAGLDEALRSLTPPAQQLSRLFVQIDQAPVRDLTRMSISNSGVIPRLRHPDSIEITDWCVITFHIRQPYPIYTAHTYAGRLVLQIVYPAELYSEEEMYQLQTMIAAQFEALAGRVA